MEDLFTTPEFEDKMFMGSDLPAEIDPITQQISELSKKGYQLLKEKKLNKIINNVDISSQRDFENLQNMLIRFLLRNIYFYESSRRRKDKDQE